MEDMDDPAAADNTVVADERLDNDIEAWDKARSTTSATILEELESQYVLAKQERDSLNLELEATKTKLNELNRTTVLQQDLELEIAKYKVEIESASCKIEAFNDERKLSQEKTDRLETEIDSLREELSRLHQKNSDLAKQVANFEIENKIAESEAIPLFHEKKRLETELSSLQSHTTWLEQELSSKSKQYQHLQRESRDRTIQLQLQLDQTINEKEGLSARLNALEKIERKLQDKVNELSLENLNCKQELATSRQNFEIDNQEQAKVINLQKEHIALWQKRYEDIARDNENLKSTAAQAMEMADKERQSEREVVEQKYEALLSEQANAYEEKLKYLTDALGRNGERKLALPASNSVIVRTLQDDDDVEGDDDGPLSMTDLYQQLAETRSALIKETNERKCWQIQFERVQKDIRSMAPKLIRQREEYEMAVDQLSDYQQRLQMALSEREEAEKEAAEARSMVGILQNRLADRQAESQELAKQVQALLVSRCSEASSTSNTDNDIPTSVHEMQSQNQRLLMEHRNLTKTVAELEKKLGTDEMKMKLDALSIELHTLQNERKEQECLVQRIVQQRDLYRALLARHDGNALGTETEELTALEMVKQQSVRIKTVEVYNQELEGDLKKIRAELTRSNTDKEELSARLSRHEVHAAELVKSIDQLERDLLTARSNEARTSSQAQYHKDHCERLETSLERARSEIVHLNQAKDELQRINTDLQHVLSNRNAENGVQETEIRQLENKLRLMQTQLDTIKSVERRVSEENAQLRSDVAKQGTVIESIRRIEASLSARNEEERGNLRRERDALSQRLEEESHRFQAELENLSTRNKDLEAKITEYETKMQKLDEEALDSERKLSEATTEMKQLLTRCNLLESQLRAAKKKMGDTSEEVNEDLAFESKIENLELEISSLKKERDTLNKDIESYQRMLKESEKSLAELQKSTEQFHSEAGDEITSLKRQLENYKSDSNSKDELLRDLTNDLASQRGEREKAIGELKGIIRSLETQIHNKEVDCDSAKAQAAALAHDMESLREELEKAQNNFERELGMHAEARTALRAAREEVDTQSRLRYAATEELEEARKALTDNIQHWEEEKLSTKETIDALEKRLHEVREQNTLLHSQLQTLTTMVDLNQKTRIESVGLDDDTPVSSFDDNNHKITSELREIVTFLRSENEIILTQLDTAKRVADRERSAALVLRRSLDEAQAELESIRTEVVSRSPDEKSGTELDERVRLDDEQLMLLKDSNKLLRDDVEKLQSHLSSVLSELDTLKKSAQPATDEQKRLESKIAGLEAEKESLRRELESWKNRVQNLVSKFHQIDPEEHKKLMVKVEELQKEKETHVTWKKATEEESARIRAIAKNLNMKNKEQKLLIDSQIQELAKLNSDKAALTQASSTNTANAKEIEELKEKIAKISSDAESKNRELDGANSRNDRLRDKLREFQTLIRDLRGKEKSLTEQLENAKAQGVSNPTNLEPTNSTPAAEKEAPTVHGTDVGAISENSIPDIPTGGFKFGPSDGSRPNSSDKIVEAKKVTQSATLHAGAPAFTPSTESTPGTAPVAIVDTLQTGIGTKTVVANTPETSPAETVRSSAASKELSMKEILLAKKMRLQEALKRKQDAERSSPKPEMDEAALEQSPKRVKTENNVVADTTTEPTPDVPSIDRSVQPEEISDTFVSAVIDEETGNSQGMAYDEPTSMFEEKTDAGQTEKSFTSTLPFFQSPTNTFTASSSQPFPSGSLTSSPNIFFSNAKGPTQPSELSTGTSAFGGAFLDMKPPGSSTTPPTFSFGSSASITLPTPTLPLTTNPFGAFSSSSSFGGFGNTTASTIPSKPLFGSNAPPQESVISNEKHENENISENNL